MADFNVGFVIFPGITQLDFTGPFEVLSRLGTPPSISVPSEFAQSKVHVIADPRNPPTSAASASSPVPPLLLIGNDVQFASSCCKPLFHNDRISSQQFVEGG